MPVLFCHIQLMLFDKLFSYLKLRQFMKSQVIGKKILEMKTIRNSSKYKRFCFRKNVILICKFCITVWWILAISRLITVNL